MDILINKNPVEYIINSHYPNIGKRKYNSFRLGDGFTFFDKKTKKTLFRYVKGGPVTKKGENFVPFYPIRLYVDYRFRELISYYVYNPDKYFKEWFENKYGEKVEEIISHIPR